MIHSARFDTYMKKHCSLIYVIFLIISPRIVITFSCSFPFYTFGCRSFRKFRLIAEDVQGRNVLTNFHGMDLTTDKLRSMVKKWQTLIEASADVKTTDGYLLRVFCIGFTNKDQSSQRKTCYAQHTQVIIIFFCVSIKYFRLFCSFSRLFTNKNLKIFLLVVYSPIKTLKCFYWLFIDQ